ncbi:MAG: GAF domain-containing protein [Tenuifilaceae bacterium]
MIVPRSVSKFLPGVLLILLIISILLVFGSYHNTLLSAEVKSTPAWAMVFLIITIIIGIFLYTLLLKAYNKSKKLEIELLEIKRSIEESKIKEVKVVEVIKEGIDVEKITKAIIPEKLTDLTKFGESFLSNIARQFDIAQGQFYMKDQSSGVFSFVSGYAYYSENDPITYKEGETLAGQAAKNKTILNIDNIPDNQIVILSGLGKGTPKHLLIVPIIATNNETIGNIELASFKAFDSEVEKLFAYLGHQLGEKLSQHVKP